MVLQTHSLELRFLCVVDVIKTWPFYKDYIFRFYNLIIATKTSF